MKVNSDFILHEVFPGNYMLAPIGKTSIKFKGVIKCNATTAFLWEKMKDDFTEESLVDDMLAQYNVSEDEAKRAVHSFLKTCIEIGVVLE